MLQVDLCWQQPPHTIITFASGAQQLDSHSVHRPKRQALNVVIKCTRNAGCLIAESRAAPAAACYSIDKVLVDQVAAVSYSVQARATSPTPLRCLATSHQGRITAACLPAPTPSVSQASSRMIASSHNQHGHSHAGDVSSHLSTLCNDSPNAAVQLCSMHPALEVSGNRVPEHTGGAVRHPGWHVPLCGHSFTHGQAWRCAP
jgi:hypothetical protein